VISTAVYSNTRRTIAFDFVVRVHDAGDLKTILDDELLPNLIPTDFGTVNYVVFINLNSANEIG
jgi:hypothetical protein